MSLPSGLSAAYEFEGTCKDSVGTNHGTPDNVSYVGTIRRGASLPPEWGEINCGNDASINFGNTDDFSIAFWVQTTGDPDGQSIFWHGGWQGIVIEILANGTLSLTFFNHADDAAATGAVGIADGTPHHVVISYTAVSHSVTMYVDGVTDTVTNGYDGSYDFLADDVAYIADAFTGIIDQFCIAGRVFSSADRIQLFNDPHWLLPTCFANQKMASDLSPCYMPQSLPSAMIVPFNTVQAVAIPSGTERLLAALIAAGDEKNHALVSGFGTGRDLALLLAFSGIGIPLAILTALGDEKNHALSFALGSGRMLALSAGFAVDVIQMIIHRMGWYLNGYQKMIGLLSRGDHVSANQAGLIPLPDEIRKHQAVLSSLSEQVAKVQKMLGLLSRGDHVSANQSNTIPLPDETRKYQAILSSLSEQVAKVQKIINLLSRGDHVPANQSGIVPLPDETRKHQAVLSSLSEQVAKVQKIINLLSRGDHTPANQSGIVPLPDETRKYQAFLTSLSEQISKAQKMIGLLSRGDHVSANQSNIIPLPDEIRKHQAVLSSLSEQVAKVQKIINLLSRGDHTPANQSNTIPLPDEIRKHQAVLSSLSEKISKIQKLLGVLSRGDHTPANQAGLIPLPDEIRKHQSVISSLSEQISKAQKMIGLLSRGNHVPVNQAGLIPLSDEARNIQNILNSLSSAFLTFQKQVNTLSGDPLIAYQQLLQSIMETHDVHMYQKISAALSDFEIKQFSIPADIYLDGRPLSDRFIKAEILCDENNVHNSLTITSADPTLFAWADPEIESGEPRVEVHVGTRLIYFMVDTRPGETIDFVINCISMSAREDAPFAEVLDFQLSDAMLASEIADNLTDYCPVNWTAPDWIVPAGFNFSGTALDGIQLLATEVKAVIRCQDDGSLLIRKRRPVRPVEMNAVVANINYDQTLLISLSQTEEPASGYNAIEITGQASDIFIPQMLLEPVEDGPYIYQTVYIRVYWAGNPVTVIDTYVTSGELTQVGPTDEFYEQIEEVVVEFKEGKASLSLPIYELVSWEWIGDYNGDIEYQQYGSDLLIADNAFRVARIKYTSRYQRYRVSGHNVERLIAVLFLEPQNEIRVQIRTADEPVWADPVNASLLTNDWVVIERGTAEIDAMKYRTSAISIEAPYDDAAIDGAIAYINDDRIGYPGNHHITSSKIVFDGPKTTNILGLEKCLISYNS